MNAIKQTFPALDIQVLESGHIQFDDPTYEGGVVHVHPAQLQVAAQLIGFTLPDRARKALGRVLVRVKALSEQASELEGLLDHALNVQDIDVVPELRMAEFIAHDLSEVFKDLEDLTAPDFEPTSEALANPGGQMTIDL